MYSLLHACLRQKPFCSKTPRSTSLFFFFNDTATTEIYTLSLHDALPISIATWPGWRCCSRAFRWRSPEGRSEEHTSELQSQSNLVCRLLLEKKNNFNHCSDVIWSALPGTVRTF